MAGVPDGRGPMETCLRRCSQARLLSKTGFGAIWASLAGASLASLVGATRLSFVGAGLTVRSLSAPVQAIIAPTSAAVEHAPRALRTDMPKGPCTDIVRALALTRRRVFAPTRRRVLAPIGVRKLAPTCV